MPMPVQGGFSQPFNSNSHPAPSRDKIQKPHENFHRLCKHAAWLEALGFFHFLCSLAFFSVLPAGDTTRVKRQLFPNVTLTHLHVNRLNYRTTKQEPSQFPPIPLKTIKSHNSIFKAMPVHLGNYSNSPSKHGPSPVPNGETKTWRRRRKQLICWTQCSEMWGEHSSLQQINVPTPAQRKGSYFIYFPLFELACT